jgi:SIR2-like domain
MIDPLLSLAVAITSRRGVFAVLLGSGLSRAAGVPTGWEVVLDLVRKVALLEGTDPGPDPAAWWHGRTGKDPSYSDLLEALGRSPAERANMLRGYFEPDEDERSRGLKTPTTAHHAIARLVRDGYIRVIVTTNFDRLLEQALEAEGVVPAVISSPAAAQGAQPLAHTACTIIKVHGDYVSTDLKNTSTELAAYDPAIDRLLDQILDEYGLIVCGWSADWDNALRAAIERAPNRRYSTYWSARGALTDTAQALVRHRHAEMLQIADADTFFAELEAKVQALATIGAQHPLSAPAAAAELKRYLPDPQAQIALHDLVIREARRLAAELTPQRFPTMAPPPTPEEVERRLVHYEERSAVCLALVTTGCYFGGAEHHRTWVHLLERLLNRPGREPGGGAGWVALEDYPILLLLYAGGAASMLGGHDDTLHALLHAERRQPNQQPRSVIQLLSRRELYNQPYVDSELVKRLPALENDRLMVPMSEWLHRRLRPWLEEFTPDEATYDYAFDRFEYLSALLQAHGGKGGWVRGRWMYLIHDEGPANPAEQIAQELQAVGEEWPLLKLGAFDGKLETLLNVKGEIDKWAAARGL